MLGLLVAALALGASNAAAGIAIGLNRVDASARVRIAVVFGAFEAGMPLVGLLLGRQVANVVGGPAHQLAGALLVLLGVRAMWASGDAPTVAGPVRLGPLVLTGFVLSLDNLVAGFALGSLHVNVFVAAATIGGVSVALTLLGLEIGNRVSARLERGAQLLGGGVLIALGLALAAGLVS